jgi:hypothetical protein
MAVTNQALADIKTSLLNVSAGLSNLSGAEKTKFENSDSAKALSGGLTSLKGTLTSEQARRTVENTKKEDKSSGSASGLATAYSKLFAENQKTKEDLAKSQSELSNANAGLSIADQQKKQVEEEAAQALIKNKKKNGQTDPDAPVDTSVGLEDIAGEDPILKAMVDSANEQRNSIASQLEVLKSQMTDADDDTQFMIRQIDNMANQQIRRQEKANENMVRGAKVAGLTAGLAQYSPETHSGIVQETINEGLALIQDIEFKAMEKKYQAKKDLRDFNYKGYLESQKLVGEYNDLKNKTIISMYEQIQKAETDAREAIKFDNEQADRNALILAPELINATPDMIAKAAAANGIELGALMRAVNDAKYEQQSRELDIVSKQESIASSRDARRRANEKTVEEEKPMSFSDLKEASERYNLFQGKDDSKTNLVPSHWTRSDFDGFISKYPNVDTFSAQEKKTAIKRYQEGTPDDKSFNVANTIGSSTNLLKKL